VHPEQLVHLPAPMKASQLTLCEVLWLLFQDGFTVICWVINQSATLKSVQCPPKTAASLFMTLGSEASLSTSVHSEKNSQF